MNKTYLTAQSSITIVILVGILFIGIGYLNYKKTTNNKNYIVGNRKESIFSLTTSLTASALGAWILFGPASAATWGGIGAVIGYAVTARLENVVIPGLGTTELFNGYIKGVIIVKVFIACLGTETNTFSNLPTGWKTFEETMLFYGDATDNEPNTFSLPLHIWRKRSEERNYEVIESVAAFAQPGGKTLDSVYEDLRDKVLSDLRSAGEVDIVLLSLHGAMTAESYEDCEGDLISCIREIVGDQTVIAAELDLHCSVTPKMVKNSNFFVTFKLYPHTDIGARAEEVFELASSAALGAISPKMSVLDCHMINKFRTSNPQMAEIVSYMGELESEEGILSVSFAHGFPWQDVPHTTAKVLVVSDDNEEKGNIVAAGLRDRIWKARDELVQPTLSIDEALSSIKEKS